METIKEVGRKKKKLKIVLSKTWYNMLRTLDVKYVLVLQRFVYVNEDELHLEDTDPHTAFILSNIHDIWHK